MKKLFSIILAFVMVIGFAACDPTTPPDDGGDPTQLETPQDLNLSGTGLISWSYVPHATEYEVTADGSSHTVQETSYQLDGIPAHDFTYSVVAKAEGYLDSAPATMTYTAPAAIVSISGDNSVLSGKSKQYKAVVTGATPATVTWSIVSGSEYAEISQDGTLTAKEVTDNKIVVIRATSVANTGKYAEKSVSVRARTQLTQEMLDRVAAVDTVEYMTSVDIDIYSAGSRPEFMGTSSLDTSTAMDGVHWYASYQMGDAAGVDRNIFYTEHDGYASLVSVSLMNEEEYTPMLDDNGQPIGWQESGLYNVFKGTADHPQNLKVSDFTFNEEEYRWDYTGADKTFVPRMIASANPYDFTPKNFWLIIEEGEVMGFMSESEVDKQVSEGNDSYMTLTAILNTENVTVPTIGKFTFDEEIHTPLKTALDNMHALDSVTMTFRHIQQSITGGVVDLTGYKETMTKDTCLYEDFEWSYNDAGEPVYTFTGYQYGFKQTSDNVYNQFVLSGTEETPVYTATRAFSGNVKDARPGYHFAPELFTRYAKPQAGDDFDMYYEVDASMYIVATEFYRYVDVLDQLYGLYAAAGSTGSSYVIPSLTVKDGYITEALFYYYLGYMAGVIEIEFSGFNSSVIEKPITFEERAVPTSWDGFLFNEYDETIKDQPFEPYAKAYLGTEESIPFFGEAIGDCYAWAFAGFYRSADGKTQKAVKIWYDVPTDLDYMPTSSVNTIRNWLGTQGYEQTGMKDSSSGLAYEYQKGAMHVAVAIENVDMLYVYVWADAAPEVE